MAFAVESFRSYLVLASLPFGFLLASVHCLCHLAVSMREDRIQMLPLAGQVDARIVRPFAVAAALVVVVPQTVVHDPFAQVRVSTIAHKQPHKQAHSLSDLHLSVAALPSSMRFHRI